VKQISTTEVANEAAWRERDREPTAYHGKGIATSLCLTHTTARVECSLSGTVDLHAMIVRSYYQIGQFGGIEN
jgi:hypothetical protein